MSLLLADNDIDEKEIAESSLLIFCNANNALPNRGQM